MTASQANAFLGLVMADQLIRVHLEAIFGRGFTSTFNELIDFFPEDGKLSSKCESIIGYIENVIKAVRKANAEAEKTSLKVGVAALVERA